MPATRLDPHTFTNLVLLLGVVLEALFVIRRRNRQASLVEAGAGLAALEDAHSGGRGYRADSCVPVCCVPVPRERNKVL